MENREQQGINLNNQATANFFAPVEQNFAPKPPQPTGDEPPNNLNRRGVSRQNFIGRDDDLEKLHELLQTQERVAITGVVGMGGVGKTELARQYAREHLNEYGGGVVWLSAERAASDLLNFAKPRFFANVDWTHLTTTEQQLAYCWRHWCPGQNPPEPVLLVFDDVRDYRQQVKPYLPEGTRFRVLLTTRKRFQSVERLDLDVLEPEDALKLLQQTMGEGAAERIAAEPETAKALCAWLGYLPLGLELVGRYLATKRNLSLAQMQGRLEEKKLAARALSRVPETMEAQLGVAAAFELSWQELSDGAQQVARVLSLFAAAPIPWERVRGCLPEMDEEDLEDWRDEELVRLHLLKNDEGNGYGLHPLIREFFAVKLAEREKTEPGEVESQRRTFAQVLTDIAKQIPQAVTLSLQAQVRAVIPHLEAATEWAHLLDDADYTWAYVGLARFYTSQSLWQTAETWYRAACQASQTRFGNDHPHTALSLNNLALLYHATGRYSDAEPLYRDALDIRRRQLGNEHPHTALSLNNLAGLYESTGRYSDAEPLYRDALDIRRRQLGNDHPHTAQSLNNLASLYRATGRYSEAEPLFRDALDIHRRQLGNDHPHTAQSLNNLAALYKSNGRYGDAEPLYRDALDIYRRQLGNDHPHTASSLNNLALLYESTGRYSDAEPLYRDALDIYRRQLGNDHPHTAQSLNNLAGLYESTGRYREAEPLYRDALDIRRRQLGNDHPDTAISFHNFAYFYQGQKKYEDAEPLYLQALLASLKSLGNDHPHTQIFERNCINFYREAFAAGLPDIRLRQHPLGEFILAQLNR